MGAGRKSGRTWRLLATSVVLALGCSSRNQIGPDSGIGTASGQAVWTANSQDVWMDCNGFARGGMTFLSTRVELTDQQLALLAGMRTGAQGTSLPDALGCRVQITANDGSIAVYQAAEQDGVLDGSAPVIAFATFEPLLASVPCVFAKDQGPQHAATPDARCLNGISLVSGPGRVDRFLTVTDASAQRLLALDGCSDTQYAQSLSMQVVAGTDPPGAGDAPVLAQAAEPPAPGSTKTCLAAHLTFPAPGTYRMRVLIAAALPTTVFSVFSFRFY